MSETIQPTGNKERDPNVYLASAWEEQLQDEEFAARFMNLLEATRTHTTDHELVKAPEELQQRWQRAVVVAGKYSGVVAWREQVSDQEFLNRALKRTHESIEQYGWETPGLGFKVLTEGFSWIVDKEGIDALQPHMFELVDLRDMEEPKPLMTMNLEAFLRMTSDEVEALRTQINNNLDREFYGSRGITSQIPAHDAYIEDAFVYRDYQKWRRYGVPDREIDSAELYSRIKEGIALEKQQNPAYGSLPESYKDFDEEMKEVVSRLIYYFDDMRDAATEAPELDTYSLYNTCDLTVEQVDKLVASAVLVAGGEFRGPGGKQYQRYALTRPYEDFWFVRHFNTPENK